MIILLLVVMVLAAITGMTAGGLFGPTLARQFGDVHELLGTVIQILAIVHVAGVLVDWFLTGDNLIAAMIGGRKPVLAEEPAAAMQTGGARDARGGSVWLGLAIAVPLVVFGGWLFDRIDPLNPPSRLETQQHD
jgi:hypothetical protein